MTVVRTHLQITPNAAAAIGDHVTWGVIVARVADVADPVTAGLVTAAQTDLDWMYWTTATANPTLARENSNTMWIDLKSKRRIREVNDRLIVSILNNQSGASQTYRVTARTLVLMP